MTETDPPVASNSFSAEEGAISRGNLALPLVAVAWGTEHLRIEHFGVGYLVENNQTQPTEKGRNLPRLGTAAAYSTAAVD